MASEHLTMAKLYTNKVKSLVDHHAPHNWVVLQVRWCGIASNPECLVNPSVTYYRRLALPFTSAEIVSVPTSKRPRQKMSSVDPMWWWGLGRSLSRQTLLAQFREILWVLEHGESHVLNANTLAIVLFWRHRQSRFHFDQQLTRTYQGITTEVSAVVLCMFVDVTDLLSEPILCPQSTVPQENAVRKLIRKMTEH